MRLLCIEHESDSGPAMLADRARECGACIEFVTPESGLPVRIGAYDGLLVMGSVASVNDADISWWFDRELALIRDADAHAVPVFGVCFGAQALAVALGGSVERTPTPEVGWTTVDTSDPCIEPGPWLNWHVDTITVPSGAHVLAASAVGVQAYRIGPHLAVQFHPEVTPAQLEEWAMSDALTAEAAGADVADILRQARTGAPAARARANRLMDGFLDACETSEPLQR